MRTMQEILEEAHALSPDERLSIAESLLQSLQPIASEIGEEWVREAERRMEAVRSGAQGVVPGEVVFAEAARQLRAE